ncbi:(2Fe-2S)-binding protein [Ammoniphilus sp. 3BR4]|uniref:(2Fe-2S)-binding protein n=1 Tax=Ammoniphilus sp. 3BR4 TaxID=3158265 RepID=UPI003466EDEC
MEISNHPILGKRPGGHHVTITFEGKSLQARENQTVASALMSQGIYKLGQSRKMAQARGLFCANGRCCSCFMTIDGQEHVRACMTQVKEGMRIRMNMGDPDVGRDSNEN